MSIEDMGNEESALFHLIMDSGLADEEQLSEVWEEHERTGTPFREVLFNFEIIEEENLMWMMAQTLDTEYIDMNEVNPGLEFMQQFNAEILRMYQIMPIREDETYLYVAAANPLDFHLIDELYQVLGRAVHIQVGKPESI
jgi:type IV pilus assembly protein PilB